MAAAAVLAMGCALAAGVSVGGCKRDPALGAPDSFVVVKPLPPRDGAAVKSKSDVGRVICTSGGLSLTARML